MNDKPVSLSALGIDYGKRNVGVAVGQTLTQSARALTVLRYGETRQSKKVLFDQLKRLVDEWKPDVLVVGWPLNMDGSESALCAEVKKFSEQLQTLTGRKIEWFDERLTSREAKMADESSTSRDYRKNPVDAEAARILLESWLRSQR